MAPFDRGLLDGRIGSTLSHAANKTSKNSILIEWVSFPDGVPNTAFLSELSQAVPNKDTPIYFLCRGGIRSVGAAIAATDVGFRHSYNILEGFEGTPDEFGHRGRKTGWQGLSLPWKH